MIYKETEIQQFKEWFCDFNCISIEALQGKSQVKTLVHLRIVFSAILLEHRVPAVKIGKIISRNHSTISHYLYKRILNEHEYEIQELIKNTKTAWKNKNTLK